MGGVWLSFGPVCQVTTPAQPMTQLQPAFCSYTLPTFSTTVNCIPVAGATNYRYHITGPNGYDRNIDRNVAQTDFKFSWTLLCCGQQNMLPNTSYLVEVASYAGGIWSDYGPACTIITGASVPRYALLQDESPTEIENSLLGLKVYPNPVAVSAQYAIELNGIEKANEKISISIMDVLGKNVYKAEVTTAQENNMLIKPETQLSAGIYTIEVIMNNQSFREKLVVE